MNPTATPSGDIANELRQLIGETGGLDEVMGSFRIKVYHTRAFPWDEVFKALLYRGFQVFITNKKADLFIEARA